MSFLRRTLLTLKERRLVHRALALLPRWITPNGVTVFRGLLAVPVMLLLAAKSFWPAIILLAFALILDFVDGALAAVRNLRSETGAFLDPLADKALICGPLLLVTLGMSWPFLAASVTITVVAIALTLVRVWKLLIVRLGKPLATNSVAANSSGKLKMVAETAGVMTLLLARAGTLGWFSEPLSWLSLALLLVALRYAIPSLLGQLRGLAASPRPRP